MSLPSDYGWYLKTNHWLWLRQQKLVESEFQCERCGEFARRSLGGRWSLLQVHHKTYERMPWHEQLDDLEVLCAECHAKHHGHETPSMDEIKSRLSRWVTNETTGWQPEDIDLEIGAWDRVADEAEATGL